MPRDVSTQPKTTLRHKAILIICGIFCCLMLLEIGLRLGGLIVTSLKEHKYRSALSAKDTFRILCFGESISLGSYPNHLERILNQSNKGVEFRVINKAMAGTDSTYILDYFCPLKIKGITPLVI